MISKIVFVTAGLLFASSAGLAQTPERQQRDSGMMRRRAALEGQVRERIAAMVKERLQLTDAQARQLQETELRLETRRRELMQREQRLRRDLRQQLVPGVAADQQRVASLLEQVMAVHRDRVTSIEQEQRELAQFLSPVQRAKYLGLQAELRGRIEGMRQGRRARPGFGPRPDGGRPPRP